jgi:Type II secretion system (T2SS), protein M subtype b
LVLNDMMASVMKPRWKLWTSLALGALWAVDLGLAVFLWEGGREDPSSLRADRDRLALQAKLLRGDIDRGERIRASLPQAGQECNDFYRDSFLAADTGYSRIESDLGAIARETGVRTSGFTFARADVKKRGATEIKISATVDADYPSLVRFINGLERSKNFYLLDSLKLNSAENGGIRLALELHTYFRT